VSLNFFWSAEFSGSPRSVARAVFPDSQLIDLVQVEYFSLPPYLPFSFFICGSIIGPAEVPFFTFVSPITSAYAWMIIFLCLSWYLCRFSCFCFELRSFFPSHPQLLITCSRARKRSAFPPPCSVSRRSRGMRRFLHLPPSLREPQNPIPWLHYSFHQLNHPQY